MKSKSNAVAIFVRERGDTVFEMAYIGRSRQAAERKLSHWRALGARAVGCELICNSRGEIKSKALR